ncbi:MAG: stage II sporulation protein M [Candidatus Hadarchaeum sp.]|uniref:stage II sporulation protein M n=1 Tax=Candidatus Hadarchaeum sp. TaxID=2883567 RepID=UPI003D0F5235
MSNSQRAFTGALSRNAPAISFMTLAFLIIMFLSTAYFLLAFDREQFLNLPEVQRYDNLLENVTVMDEWSRTKFYWSNNIRVAGIYAATFPFYTSTASILMTGQQIGLALVYNYHLYGPIVLLTFLAVIFLHGTLELTGAFVIGAASLRLGWDLWKTLGKLLKTGKVKITRKKMAAAKQRLIDYLALILLGSILIILAAPIEAYLSPSASALFLFSPFLAILLITAAMLFFASVIKAGFSGMIGEISVVLKEVREPARGRWKPSHLPLLTFIIFSLLTWLGLLI